LPTEESHKLSVRTQQIIAYENKAANSADPLGGSYLAESLTKEIEERAWELMKVIEEKGDFIRCFKDGWVEKQVNEARYRYADAIESNEQTIVGVNKFQDEDEEIKISVFRNAEDMQAVRIRYVQDYKKNRNQEPAKRALQNIYDLTKNKPETNMFEPTMEAVKAKATMQEICDAMRQAYNFEMPR
jgi:methylmalonyl-CoA mutase N-terminal domain/subunit